MNEQERAPLGLILLAGIAGAIALLGVSSGQQTPPPNPLQQPMPTSASDRLKISYLVEVPRGELVFLRLQSGDEVAGFAINTKDEQDVLVLELVARDSATGGWAKTGLVGLFKGTAIAGVSYEPGRKPERGGR